MNNRVAPATKRPAFTKTEAEIDGRVFDLTTPVGRSRMELYFVIDVLRSGKQLQTHQVLLLAYRLEKVLDGNDSAQRLFGLTKAKDLKNRNRYIALDYALRTFTLKPRDKLCRTRAQQAVAKAWKVGGSTVDAAHTQHGRVWLARINHYRDHWAESPFNAAHASAEQLLQSYIDFERMSWLEGRKK